MVELIVRAAVCNEPFCTAAAAAAAAVLNLRCDTTITIIVIIVVIMAEALQSNITQIISTIDAFESNACLLQKWIVVAC